MGTSERRRFLQVMSALIGGAAVVGIGGRMFGQQGAVEAARSAVRLPAPSGPPVPSLPDEVIQSTRDKYVEAFRVLTVNELQ